ncbi:hypothetical protein HanPSC8_Chr07g0271621 [Helianthus annuus]|nr:hypothetical protein HanPSC8_Chr07g0271621 [Helianthus annuus]
MLTTRQMIVLLRHSRSKPTVNLKPLLLLLFNPNIPQTLNFFSCIHHSRLITSFITITHTYPFEIIIRLLFQPFSPFSNPFFFLDFGFLIPLQTLCNTHVLFWFSFVD